MYITRYLTCFLWPCWLILKYGFLITATHYNQWFSRGLNSFLQMVFSCRQLIYFSGFLQILIHCFWWFSHSNNSLALLVYSIRQLYLWSSFVSSTNPKYHLYIYAPFFRTRRVCLQLLPWCACTPHNNQSKNVSSFFVVLAHPHVRVVLARSVLCFWAAPFAELSLHHRWGDTGGFVA